MINSLARKQGEIIMLRMAVIQLTDTQLNALRKFQRTRSVSVAVEIVDNIIEDLHLDREVDDEE